MFHKGFVRCSVSDVCVLVSVSFVWWVVCGVYGVCCELCFVSVVRVDCFVCALCVLPVACCLLRV